MTQHWLPRWSTFFITTIVFWAAFFFDWSPWIFGAALGLGRAVQGWTLFGMKRWLRWLVLSYSGDWVMIFCVFFGFPWTGVKALPLAILGVGLLAQNALEGHALVPAINRASWLAGAVGAYAVAAGVWLLFWQSGGLGLADPSRLRHAGIWVFLLVSATARASGAELVFARRPAHRQDMLESS